MILQAVAVDILEVNIRVTPLTKQIFSPKPHRHIGTLLGIAQHRQINDTSRQPLIAGITTCIVLHLAPLLLQRQTAHEFRITAFHPRISPRSGYVANTLGVPRITRAGIPPYHASHDYHQEEQIPQYLKYFLHIFDFLSYLRNNAQHPGFDTANLYSFSHTTNPTDRHCTRCLTLCIK